MYVLCVLCIVLDCIASGTVWVDMKELGIDVVISAPQKGWTGPSCAALVMMSEEAVEKMNEILNKEIPIPKRLSLEARDFLKNILKKNPAERIGCRQ